MGIRDHLFKYIMVYLWYAINFASFATYTLFLAFAVRSLDKSIIAYNPFSNWHLTLGVTIGIAAIEAGKRLLKFVK